ncbi:uncharacterized protein MYCFIDRAFT_180735 [Pseudocercospora fijiensis CIRAD86]|uniref:Uncharacterized protein n=1 Tax=Pseudocercospora fijiensis (strain CIRAD86) TaxID=383855 RepID=M3AGY5_PSEFD|nr:uncharacterized protein MYCFIDRAFT_180735 [Pseudocercospora fijiensis CIRAD86]EME76747.1 hypothetical protein MYCFIDRAFT_180735 [Pseudocercospora fijiensis CIRAD86]
MRINKNSEATGRLRDGRDGRAGGRGNLASYSRACTLSLYTCLWMAWHSMSCTEHDHRLRDGRQNDRRTQSRERTRVNAAQPACAACTSGAHSLYHSLLIMHSSQRLHRPAERSASSNLRLYAFHHQMTAHQMRNAFSLPDSQSSAQSNTTSHDRGVSDRDSDEDEEDEVVSSPDADHDTEEEFARKRRRREEIDARVRAQQQERENRRIQRAQARREWREERRRRAQLRISGLKFQYEERSGIGSGHTRNAILPLSTATLQVQTRISLRRAVLELETIRQTRSWTISHNLYERSIQILALPPPFERKVAACGTEWTASRKQQEQHKIAARCLARYYCKTLHESEKLMHYSNSILQERLPQQNRVNTEPDISTLRRPAKAESCSTSPPHVELGVTAVPVTRSNLFPPPIYYHRHKRYAHPHGRFLRQTTSGLLSHLRILARERSRYHSLPARWLTFPTCGPSCQIPAIQAANRGSFDHPRTTRNVIRSPNVVKKDPAMAINNLLFIIPVFRVDTCTNSSRYHLYDFHLSTRGIAAEPFCTIVAQRHEKQRSSEVLSSLPQKGVVVTARPLGFALLQCFDLLPRRRGSDLISSSKGNRRPAFNFETRVRMSRRNAVPRQITGQRVSRSVIKVRSSCLIRRWISISTPVVEVVLMCRNRRRTIFYSGNDSAHLIPVICIEEQIAI